MMLATAEDTVMIMAGAVMAMEAMEAVLWTH